MSIYILIATWCIAYPVPFCMTMEMPDLTIDQCEASKKVTLKQAIAAGAFKGTGACIRAIGYPT
jgi:hypothetical protein